MQGDIPAEQDMRQLFNNVFQEPVLDLTFEDEDLESVIKRIYNT